jgi:hypothetical protein
MVGSGVDLKEPEWERECKECESFGSPALCFEFIEVLTWDSDSVLIGQFKDMVGIAARILVDKGKILTSDLVVVTELPATTTDAVKRKVIGFMRNMTANWNGGGGSHVAHGRLCALCTSRFDSSHWAVVVVTQLQSSFSDIVHHSLLRPLDSWAR